jgi:predicted metal-dependent phosphoesterase TrpH
MIKADLHVHTSYSVDGLMSPEEIVGLSRSRGIGALAVTDHNTIGGAHAVRKVAPFPIIVGEEVSTVQGEILGLFLEEEVPRGLSARETVRRIRDQGGLVGVPHPFDRLRVESLEGSALSDIADQLDFIEGLNSRTMFAGDNRRAQEFAALNALPCTAGSDAHIAHELGRAYVELPALGDRGQFLAHLRDGHIGGGLSPFWVHFFSIYERARNRLRRE